MKKIGMLMSLLNDLFLYTLCRTKDITVATARAAFELMWHLFSNLTGRQSFQVDLLKLSISILLYSLCHLEDLIAKQLVEANIMNQIFQRCHRTLENWITSTNVIGGSFFGGKVSSHGELALSSMELKVRSHPFLF